ncbi:MAG: hypothetical protein CEN88_329 [Candidatus Berkelbacteria bacterium Licking1014_2]|uniref:Uncharacterized protein n=1 Tax=Candidatus Berkelbacteria bacterium Licking1014_2 TaxID=2017146 RepID=A0A554LUG0_9BACT|nr:MAG: hypothetical protein CEN88_329 [Candidatus Berkelbacteria bacterium Licking1014_2]
MLCRNLPKAGVVWYDKNMKAKTSPYNTTNFNQLSREIVILRSFIIGLAGRDKEGEYRPEFVERVLKAGQEKTAGIFSGSRDFLARLKKYGD